MIPGRRQEPLDDEERDDQHQDACAECADIERRLRIAALLGAHEEGADDRGDDADHGDGQREVDGVHARPRKPSVPPTSGIVGPMGWEHQSFSGKKNHKNLKSVFSFFHLVWDPTIWNEAW